MCRNVLLLQNRRLFNLQKALKENSEKPRIVERLKTNLKKAKLENEGDRIAELIVEAISFLPNYKKGQEKILKEIYK